MYSKINVSDHETASITLSSGWSPKHYVKLVGATFPVVPAGTFVDTLSVNVPGGLHALAFFCRVDEPRRVGSGPTAYLDHSPVLTSSVLLSWKEGDKLIIKADKDMSALELGRFNPFVRSNADVFVVDAQNKTAYVSFFGDKASLDPSWVYKLVSMESILEYITKKLTLEELGERATSEQRARDEMLERNRALETEVWRLNSIVFQCENDLEDAKTHLSEEREIAETLKRAQSELRQKLMKSIRLHEFLKRIPARLRPKIFEGFIEAMDSLK